MKKTSKLFAVLVMAASIFAFTGCNLWAKLQGPEQEWEEYVYDYSVGNGSVKLDCFVMFTSEDVTIEKVDLKAGLNVLIVPDADSGSDLIDDLLGEAFEIDKNYIIKNFPLNTKVEIQEDETEESTQSFTMTKNKWTILYNGVKWEAENSAEPGFFLKRYKPVEVNENFSWKKVLAGLIVKKLLD